MQITFILYVNNQKESTEFYTQLLDLEPSLFKTVAKPLLAKKYDARKKFNPQ